MQKTWEVFRQSFEFAPDHLGDPAANAAIDFVKHQGGDLLDRGEDALQG